MYADKKAHASHASHGLNTCNTCAPALDDSHKYGIAQSRLTTSLAVQKRAVSQTRAANCMVIVVPDVASICLRISS